MNSGYSACSRVASTRPVRVRKSKTNGTAASASSLAGKDSYHDGVQLLDPDAELEAYTRRLAVGFQDLQQTQARDRSTVASALDEDRLRGVNDGSMPREERRLHDGLVRDRVGLAQAVEPPVRQRDPEPVRRAARVLLEDLDAGVPEPAFGEQCEVQAGRPATAHEQALDRLAALVEAKGDR